MSEVDQQYRIIAIDDEQSILDYYQEVLCGSSEGSIEDEFNALLEDSGFSSGDESNKSVQFDLTTTISGEVGFNHIKQGLKEGHPFAVAFIDMRMPGGWDGLHTAKEVRAIDPYVTIIFLSAYMDYSLSDIRNSIGDHFSFLTKPIHREELHQVALTSSNTWQQLREVRRLNKSKDDFLASISHELRTPLTAIIGNAELVLDEIGDELDYAHRTMLQTILKAGKGQLTLVNDVLDISKIQAGRFKIENDNFDLEVLLQGVESLFRAKAIEQNVTFEVVLKDPQEYLLLGDTQRIHQILVNLLSNALKFTEEGRVGLTVTVRDQQLCFEVKDSGIGINEKALDRLFTPFEQADSSISRRFGGTGLGLSISKSLATMMDGALQVESEEGVGSTFTLYLPLTVTNERVEKESEESATPGSSALFFKGKVLVAEDTPELQGLLRHMLERVGVTVAIANNGEEAVEIALREQMDLVLMDMQMPVMDGIEATRMLRSAFYSAPIFALTANVMDDHKHQFKEAGTDGFLAKPVNKKALLAVLSRYLESVDGAELALDEGRAAVSSEAELIFRKELMRNANKLRDALYIDNLSAIQQIAHKLKGTGSSFGYDELSSIGKQVCDAHHQGRYDAVRSLSNTMLMLALKISSEDQAEDGQQKTESTSGLS